jgi:hypothetical protein
MKQTGLSAFEALYRFLSTLIKGIREDLKEISDFTLRQQMQALRLTLAKINDWVWERLSTSLTTTMYPYRPGDAIWVKEWNVKLLKPHWRGPFCVIFLPLLQLK